MISLKKSISDLQRYQELSTTALHCYRDAVSANREYAIEFDHGEAQAFCTRLGDILYNLELSDSRNTLQLTQKTLREQLKDYQKKASQYVKQLRDELANTSNALVELLQSISREDSNPEEQLRNGLLRLRSVAGVPAVKTACPELPTILTELEAGVADIEARHRLVVAQLQDEISTLHRTMDRASGRNSRGGATMMGRSQLEELIEAEYEGGSNCYLFLIWVENLRRISRQAGAASAAEVLQQLGAKVAAEAEAAVGHWTNEVVVGVVSGNRDTMESLRRFPDRLAGPYSVVSGGSLKDFKLQLRTGIVQRSRYRDAQRFQQACDNLARALQGKKAE